MGARSAKRARIRKHDGRFRRMCNGGHGGEAVTQPPSERPLGSRVLATLALASAIAIVALVAPARRAGAAEPRGPRVVWAGEGRVYVAAPDSGALAPGRLV